MGTENRVVHTAAFGPAPDRLAVWHSEFGDPRGFGAYDVELWTDRPAELIWVFEGVMTAHVGDRRWVLTPAHAIWIPADWPSEVVPNRPARAYCLQLPGSAPVRWRRPTLVRTTPMLESLLHHLGRPELSEGAGIRAHQVLYDLLEPVADLGLQLPIPSDPRMRTIAETLLADPGDQRTLEEWGETVYASAKTLQRGFLAETGMRFPDWRTHARLYAALPLLADGLAIGAVAERVGYRSTNGFIEAFRRQFGRTPSRFAG